MVEAGTDWRMCSVACCQYVLIHSHCGTIQICPSLVLSKSHQFSHNVVQEYDYTAVQMYCYQYHTVFVCTTMSMHQYINNVVQVQMYCYQNIISTVILLYGCADELVSECLQNTVFRPWYRCTVLYCANVYKTAVHSATCTHTLVSEFI